MARQTLTYSIDVSAMAAALGKTPREMLDEWGIDKGGMRLASALKWVRAARPNSIDQVEHYGKLAAHFIQEEIVV